MVCNAGVDIFCRSDEENKGSTTKEDGVEGSGCALRYEAWFELPKKQG